MKTIGVIIPNYNSGIYIKRCLDSLLEQEYRVNEIIVVDDCSTDESTKIVKEYTKKYNNIILLENEKNMGVSYSRNRGIENTKSEYIMFCDSDDWYEKQATKKMMEKVEDGADFVFVGYYITYKDGRKIEAKYNTFNNIEITKETCISYLPITSWAKLIKKSILVEHNIKYPVGIKNCEELPVIPVAGFYAQKIVYIDECLYNYFQRENSASNHRLEDLSFYDITYEKFKNQLPQEYKKSINIRMVEHLLYSKTYSLIKEKHLKKEIIENINKCKKNLDGQDINTILKQFPVRKRIFIKCALAKFVFPLKCSITTKNDRRIKLDNYKDYSHYLEKINEYIAEKMKRESKLLNKDNYKEYFSNAREFFMNYNYDEIFY